MKFKYNLNTRILKLAKELDIEVRSEFEYDEWWFFQQPEGKPKMIIEVLVEHNRLKNWEKLKGGEVWYINQLLDPMGEELITWQQVKKLFNQRSSEKKATWF